MRTIPKYSNYTINKEGRLINHEQSRVIIPSGKHKVVHLKGDNGEWKVRTIVSLIEMAYGEGSWVLYAPIPGYEYSEFGELRNVKTGRVCKILKGRKGYRIRIKEGLLYVRPETLIAQHPLNNQQEK